MPEVNLMKRTICVIILACLFVVGPAAIFGQLYSGKKAEVVIDPVDKTNITGYIQIAYAWGELLIPPQDLPRGVINLKEAMNRYTKIETHLDTHLILSTERLLEMPFVYVSTKQAFDLTETERKNLRKYFENGGFLVAENAEPLGDLSRGAASLKRMLLETIPNARFAPIPVGHPLYHCFFDFDDGAPNGAEIGTYGRDTDFKGTLMSKPVFGLEGVWYRGRLAAVYSDKGYIVKWNDSQNNEPQLKMGVNFIVFALTQEGGIASTNRNQ